MKLIKELNFDFEAGRQDISEHPFSTSFGPQDVRITTRISEDDFGNMTWSCIHEVGHALYEQGLPAEHYGLPLRFPFWQVRRRYCGSRRLQIPASLRVLPV